MCVGAGRETGQTSSVAAALLLSYDLVWAATGATTFLGAGRTSSGSSFLRFLAGGCTMADDELAAASAAALARVRIGAE